MSKVKRFNINKKNEKQQIASKNVEKDKTNEIVQKECQKQPFGISQVRFKKNNKEKLGPGSYTYQLSTTKSSPILNQHEKRFK